MLLPQFLQKAKLIKYIVTKKKKKRQNRILKTNEFYFKFRTNVDNYKTNE